MRHLSRALEPALAKAARSFPAVVLTGPRRAGKTWLLRHALPGASYRLLEDPDVISRFRHDARAFLDQLRPPVILDEIQNVPEALPFVRTLIDRAPRRTGQWFLTGSQDFGLMKDVTESMAGRTAVLHLMPLSTAETPRVSMLRGGYPEVIARPRAASLWFSSYVQTWLERDVRSITAVHDLSLFRRFLGLVASRHGQILNKSDLAAPLGMSVPSVSRWLDILQSTAQILMVPPFFENLGKRLIKSPKVYIADPGLACFLLGIETDAELRRSPFFGPVFEGFIASEIVKSQTNAGRRPELYYFRDQQGLEVNFVVPGKAGKLQLIEAKATSTPTPSMAAPMRRLAEARELAHGAQGRTEMTLVHLPSRGTSGMTAMAPGVSAVPWDEFSSIGSPASRQERMRD